MNIVGSIVHVCFNGSDITLCSRAKVHHQPLATGDSWVFEDCESKRLYYVSEGCTVTVLAHSGAEDAA